MRLSTVLTGVIWGLLSATGLLAYYLSGDIGVPAIATLLSKLNGISVAFIAAFWVGGIAALFSTADSLLYSFLVVWNYDPKKGLLKEDALTRIQPWPMAVGIALTATLVFGLVVYLKLPIEQLVFLVFGISLNLFPAFVRAYRKLPQKPSYIVASVILYMGLGVVGLVQPNYGFHWSLAATLMPIIAGIAAVFGAAPAALSQKSSEQPTEAAAR